MILGSSVQNNNTGTLRERQGRDLSLDFQDNPKSQQNHDFALTNPFLSTNPFETTSKQDINIVNNLTNSPKTSLQQVPVSLWKVIKDDKDNQLKQYLESSKIRLKSTEPFQMSLLHYAVMCGSLRSIKILVVNGCAVNALDSAGHTPLLYAIEKHYGDISRNLAESLLNCGANPNEGDTINDFSPLNAACLAGNEDIVKSLILRGVTLNQEDNRLKWSPLHWACAGGSFPIVKYLVNEKGIKFQKNRHPTPETIAKDSGFIQIAQFLAQIHQ